MKQTQNNPTCNLDFDVTTYTFTTTAASGRVNTTSASSLSRGQSFILGATGASANGFVKNQEYFVVPVASGYFRVADTFAEALSSDYSTTASGDIGSGTIYPIYKVGGVLFVGSSGNVNIRGIGVPEGGGLTSFSVHKNIADGSMLPMMIKDLCASGTTASDFVGWSN